MMRNAMHPLSMARDTLNAQHFSDASFADEIVKGTFAMGYLGDLVGLVTLIFSLKSVAIGWAYSVSFAVVGYYLLWWIMPTLYHDWCFYIQLYVLMPASFLVNLVKCFVQFLCRTYKDQNDNIDKIYRFKRWLDRFQFTNRLRSKDFVKM